MNTQFSTAPWHAQLAKFATRIVDDKGAVIASSISADDTGPPSIPRIAKAMAAAPEALEFINRWRDAVLGGEPVENLSGWQREFYEEATAVLNKAVL